MYDAMDITEEGLGTYVDNEAEVSEFELGNSRLGITVIMVMAALVGAWGTACIVSGLANSSVNELGRHLLTAFTGM
ncbi:MAG: hypothetical protein A2521_03280 [Deltaproteobacteria bacterium RIFOXYD12_FULL_57_12]|nr:MAG: hypothetical protein A2521_03280 [Deltaproteobacteria bacterium RIFOXYD12_FULL_57_12]